MRSLLLVSVAFAAAHALRGAPVRIQRACVPRMADAAAIQSAADAVLAQKKMLLSPALATSNVAKLGEEAAAADWSRSSKKTGDSSSLTTDMLHDMAAM